MLKQATCIPYGQSFSLACRPLARSTRQHTSLIGKSPNPTLEGINTKHFGRALSTRNNGAGNSRDGDAPLTTTANEKEVNSRSKDGQEAQAGNEVRDDGKQSIVITPRFQWRWRWHYSDSERKKRQNTRAGKRKDGIEKDAGNGTSSSAHFLPTRSVQEQNQLQSVMDSLGKMSEELQPPPSPLEKSLENNEWTPKRQPTKQERMKLAYNPWAIMLADRLRFDAASRVRLPGALLLPLGQVTNPIEGSVYLMPDDLANLEAYDDRLQKGVRRIALMNLHREQGGTTVNVSPYKPLIDELTEELVVWDSKLEGCRTKNGAVAKRLLPTRWIEKTQRAKAYQAASKDYWDLKEKLGETDEQDFRRPEPPFDVMNLQWQVNVAERVQSIMRQRLLLSIEHLGRKVDEPRSRPRKHVMRFDWPKSLSLNVMEESTKIPAEEKSSDDSGVNYSLAAQLYKSAEKAAMSPDSAAFPASWIPNPTAYHFVDPDIWLPGSCFLHIGPPETALTALSPSQQSTPSAKEQHFPHLTTDKFIPPMLKVNNNLHLPVFNIPALLGSDPRFNELLHKILTRHGMGPPPAVTKSNDNSGQDTPSTTNNYLILIRATAPGYHYVARELWQLWRYLGGTDCLRPELLDLTRSAPRTNTQRQKDKVKRYEMSDRVWEHLGTFLEGVEGMPPRASDKERSSKAGEGRSGDGDGKD